VSWKVRKFTPLKKLGVPYNGWVHVKDMEGDKHWIMQKFLTEKYHCLMVQNTTLIRTGPGLKYNEKFKEPAEKYETFKFLRAKRGWIEVMDVHGDVGWLQASDVWTD
jgi:SH3-like domain-containing protein